MLCARLAVGEIEIEDGIARVGGCHQRIPALAHGRRNIRLHVEVADNPDAISVVDVDGAIRVHRQVADLSRARVVGIRGLAEHQRAAHYGNKAKQAHQDSPSEMCDPKEEVTLVGCGPKHIDGNGTSHAV